jgi:hypothetical protein
MGFMLIWLMPEQFVIAGLMASAVALSTMPPPPPLPVFVLFEVCVLKTTMTGVVLGPDRFDAAALRRRSAKADVRSE